MRHVKNIVMVCFLCSVFPGTSYSLRVSFPFEGKAEGGTLIIGSTEQRNADYISIDTQPGESAKSVMERVAIEMVDSEEFFIMPSNMTFDQKIEALLPSGVLTIFGRPGAYFTSGTETGFNIPKPPLSLSCSYFKEADEIVLNWENPVGGYDEIYVLARWDVDRIVREEISGNLTEHRMNAKKMELFDTDFYVLGVKDGLPSSPGCISITDNGKSQHELCGIPFRNGLLPNWKTWDKTPNRKKNLKSKKEMSLFPDRPGKEHYIFRNSDKPYKQILNVSEKNQDTGIFRKFLGLKGDGTIN